MNKLDGIILPLDIKSSMKLVLIVKFIKFLLVLLIIIAYFMELKWLNEIIIVAVILNLILPMNFFDVFIQKLLEYNTQILENRILLNANEINDYFEKNDKFKKSIQDKIKFLKINIKRDND